MLNPTDILDKDLYYKTPLFGKVLDSYISVYGKDCTFYINPNHEGSENNTETNDKEHLINQDNVNDSYQRLDNYTLAYGKDLVGYDYSKLQKVDAKLLAEYKDYYVHDIGAEDNVMFYLRVKDTPIARGDIISYNIQDKQVFYRITEKMQSFQEILYRVTCKLVQVKKLGGGRRPYDVHNHKADYAIPPKDGIVL